MAAGGGAARGGRRMAASTPYPLDASWQAVASLAVTIADPRPPTADLQVEVAPWIRPGAPLRVNVSAISYIGAEVAGARIGLTWRVSGSGAGADAPPVAVSSKLSSSSSASTSSTGATAQGTLNVTTGAGGFGSVDVPLDRLAGVNATQVRGGGPRSIVW